MNSNEFLSLRSVIKEEISKIDNGNTNEEELSKKFTEIAKCFDVNIEYLKKNKRYKIHKDDVPFVKSLIVEKYEESYMDEIRREKFSCVEIDYIENIIKGFSSMLTKVIEDKDTLNNEIKKMYVKTKINVRQKSIEVEAIINKILNKVKEYYSDSLVNLQEEDTIIYNLEILKNNIENNYKHLIDIENALFEKKSDDSMTIIREINKKVREEDQEHDKEMLELFQINRVITYILNYDEDKEYENYREKYKKLNKELDELYDGEQYKKKKDKKLKDINDLRGEIEKKVLAMDDKNRNDLIKKSSDIKNYLYNK